MSRRADFDGPPFNFPHGTELTTSSGELLVVHAPRWWMLRAHARWLIARLHRRTVTITLSTGGTLRALPARGGR